MTCVSADADVLDVVDAIAPALRPGTIVIDCSTVSADTARERRAPARDAHMSQFLDAPVSGGVEGARDGTLAIMVGGDAGRSSARGRCCSAMGRTVTHFGAERRRSGRESDQPDHVRRRHPGGGRGDGVREGRGPAARQLIDTLGKGAGSSWYFVNRAPNIVRDAIRRVSACGCTRRT